jgi:methyl-accepting chemotaxis protein
MTSARPWFSIDLHSISNRLHLATAVAIIAVAALLTLVYQMESSRLEDARVTTLRSVVETATAVAADYAKAEQSGRLTRQDAQQGAMTAIGTMRYSGSEYLYISDMQNRMVMTPANPALIGKDLSDLKDGNGKHVFVAFSDLVRARDAGVVDYMWPRVGSQQPIRKLSYIQGFKPWGWIIGTGVYVDDLDAARRSVALKLLGLGAATGLLVGIVIWRLGRSVARPVHNLVLATDRLSRGEFADPIPERNRRDELGTLAQALEVLKANSIERVRLERSAADERAVKDRRQVATDRFTNDFAEVIAGVLGRLGQAARTMSETAREMTGTAEQTRASATRTVDSAAMSSRDLSTVASATAELSSSVSEIARQMAHASEATRDAVRQAAESNTKFEHLSEMAKRIGAISGVISAIAEQTNLLGLNATIEAARAGETGKGFAVVAGEVKALATQTARATAEIIESVSSIRIATQQTVGTMADVCTAIGKMETISNAIAAAMEQQNAATGEISSSVQTVAVASDRTATEMAELATVADATGAMSRDVLVSSNELGEVAETLRAEVNHFLKVMTEEKPDLRRYERISGNNMPATLIADATQRIAAVIDNISRTGIALKCSFVAPAGSEVQVILPGQQEPAAGRVIRHAGSIVAIAFRQDDATLARVSTAVDVVASGQGLPRAA